MDFNIDEALAKDKNLRAGMEEYQRIESVANDVAGEISTKLIESIVKEQGKFNITTAVLATAKALSALTSYMYDSEEEFLIDVRKARTTVVSDVIPALLDPQPCGLCDNCKNGDPLNCMNPKVRGDYTTSRFIPIVANMLIEYDLYNKVLYMHTAGKVEPGFDEASEKKEEEN